MTDDGAVDGLLAALAEDPADELSTLLVELRWLIVKHPIAARAAFRTLVAEGRLFAATDEGARWRHRLEASPLIRRGRPVWELATLNMLDEDASRALPTQLIDALCHAAARADLEPALARRLEPDADLDGLDDLDDLDDDIDVEVDA
jgi:hypothetical protein